jgi:hypothetical protein
MNSHKWITPSSHYALNYGVNPVVEYTSPTEEMTPLRNPTLGFSLWSINHLNYGVNPVFVSG